MAGKKRSGLAKDRRAYGCACSPPWPPAYRVTYYGNTNTGGIVPVDSNSPYVEFSVVTVLGNNGSPALSKTGYIFAGWNTSADGSGTPYVEGNTFIITANTRLYAQWTPLYTVVYNNNGGTGTQTDPNSPYITGSSVTVLNQGTMARIGYIFAGWNTSADGSGTSYSPSNTFIISANTTLYAQWTPLYTVAYNNNGGTGTQTDPNSPYITGSSVTVLNQGTMARIGYIFASWNTSADGSGTSYSPSNTFIISANTTLYAQWTLVPSNYTVTYDGNTNTSGSPPIDVLSPYSPGSTVTVLGNNSPPALEKINFVFAGWNSLPDGSGTTYVGGNTFIINANTVLYAKWMLVGANLSYLPGTGGIGTAPLSSGTYYNVFSTQPVVGNTYTNAGSSFGGWNTLANGSGTSYPPGSTIIMTTNILLYAQWSTPPTTYNLTYNENSAAGGSGTAPNSPNPTIYSSNATATILGNTGPYVNSDPTKIFYGWNTVANGTGISFLAGSTVTMNTSKTLYAQWGNSPYVTVTYDANGATGGAVPAPTNYPSGVQVPILGQGSLTNTGYTFLGWNGSSTGAGSLYSPGYTFTSNTVTLYAQWAIGTPLKTCGGGGYAFNVGQLYATTATCPYAMIIRNTNTITPNPTITICTNALFGTNTTNYGSGTYPTGIISMASKVVITSTNITINTNTSYINSASNNNYSQTITNAIANYWPSGATILGYSFPQTFSERNSNPFSPSLPPTYDASTRKVNVGCGITGASYILGNVYTFFSWFVQGVTIFYSDGTTTRLFSCPANAVYTINRTTNPIVWSNPPNSSYPYYGLTPNTSDVLTAINIIRSTGSRYVNPPMPDYTVQYNGNGAGGGNLPPPQYMSPYTATTSITIGAQGSLSKGSPPNIFSGWNTAANGSGTDYAPGATYNGGASLILYAKWV